MRSDMMMGWADRESVPSLAWMLHVGLGECRIPGCDRPDRDGGQIIGRVDQHARGRSLRLAIHQLVVVDLIGQRQVGRIEDARFATHEAQKARGLFDAQAGKGAIP